jgi:hypothetical protein
MWSGAALIAAGILMIIPQLYFEILLMQKLVHPNTSGAEFEASKGLRVSTSYVGVMVVVVGAFLETVGYLAILPWRDTSLIDRLKAMKKAP